MKQFEIHQTQQKPNLIKIKLCGFTEIESLKTAIAQKCDFVGFVFCETSVRRVDLSTAAKLAKFVPNTIAKVAVVVDCDPNFLAKIITELAPEFVQFHGNETPEFLHEFRQKFPQTKIIKAFRIEQEKDLAPSINFENCADFFLFDNKIAGSGEKFDWKILQNFSSKKAWFLSGGLNTNNIKQALEISGAKMIDVSSGIEEIRGKKSLQLIENFMKKVKNYAGQN